MGTEVFELCPNDHDSGEEQEKFVIDNAGKAEWALKKIAEIDTEYTRYSETCGKYINFYTAKKIEAEQKRDREREFFLSMLKPYFESTPHRSTKTQSTLELPSGKMVKKFAKQELKYNEQKLIELLEGTEFVKIKPVLAWGEYKKTLKILGEKVVDENGEIIEGVTVVTKPETFDVELSVVQLGGDIL